ncbi:YlcI/YnfO family protein [Acidovorax sp. sif0715]|uniref:YlcI/YnfO family protein n=1 Tax=unclassified Acidovorax TaxID=2684926 RepID=UPI00351CB7ED
MSTAESNQTRQQCHERHQMSLGKQQQTRITLRIPQMLQDKAKAKADAEHISLNAFIVRAVEAVVQQKKAPKSDAK